MKKGTNIRSPCITIRYSSTTANRTRMQFCILHLILGVLSITFINSLYDRRDCLNDSSNHSNNFNSTMKINDFTFKAITGYDVAELQNRVANHAMHQYYDHLNIVPMSFFSVRALNDQSFKKW